MNAVAECLNTVQTIDRLVDPLILQKKQAYARVHKLINERLSLWCDQFEDRGMPHFNGVCGFGFDVRWTDQIFEDEKLIALEIDGQNAVAIFETDAYAGDMDARIKMTIPLRYLNEKDGEALMLEDAKFLRLDEECDLSGRGAEEVLSDAQKVKEANVQ